MDSVYVGNLPPDVRIKDIDDFFRPFGKLVYIDVNHRANPVYALVQFDSPRNAFMAVKSRHGYNYRGYTLQLRMAESEVRKRRDATPPPPPPSMHQNYGMQGNRGGFGNNYDNFSNDRMGQNFNNSSASSSFQPSQWGSFDNYNNRSNMSQYSNNRTNMGQQNMMDYSSNNRSNMLYSSSSGRSNMSQQNMTDYSSNNRSDRSYSNDRSNMSQQNMNYSSNNRSNMSYSPNDRFNMPQQNMMNYSSNNRSNMSYSSNDRSNMPQQDMMNFSNTNQSNMNYSNNSNWGNNDLGGDNIGGNNFVYNASKDPYANASFEDHYTRGLSGAGRKWFNRYIREGYSAERAREKALERRTVPYLRDDPRAKPIANDPTNAALENIGTTLISLLSNTAGNQMMPSYSNWGGDNYQAGGNSDMPGPSRGRGEPRNAVSRRQYLKSLDILKQLRTRGSKSAQDRLTKKYHTQIVSDYERYQKSSRSESENRNTTARSSSVGKSYTQLLVAFKKKKQHLLISSRKMGGDKNARTSGAFRKRMRILMAEGDFPEIEAKALAVHPLSQLKILMAMKADYEAALKRKQEKFSPIKRAANKRAANEKSLSYRNDIKYLKSYEKYRVENLSSRIKTALRACLNRIHKHEREKNLPLTKTKFSRFLPPDNSGKKPSSQRRRRGRKTNKDSKKVDSKSDTKKQDDEKDEAKVKEEDTTDGGDQGTGDANEEHEECENNENITEEQQDEDIQGDENAEQDE